MSIDKHIEKTWAIREVELREEIAKQIESGCSWDGEGKLKVCVHCEVSAIIARGNG